jgi:hypothetical protein
MTPMPFSYLAALECLSNSAEKHGITDWIREERDRVVNEAIVAGANIEKLVADFSDLFDEE